MPSAEEIDRAQRFVAAADEAEAAGVGAYQVDGQMVDAPFVVRARMILDQARQAGLLTH
jgi:citrate lyase subunit beta/citryl-CoA lyase